MAEPYELKLPVLAVGMEEGDIIEWLVGIGDAVERDQPLCLVEAEKVTIELESPIAGRMRQILVAAGSTAAVGESLAILDR